MKRLFAILAVIFTVATLFGACSSADSGVQVYTVEEKFNSDTVNQWKTLYLLDGDNYVLTVEAMDSRDASRQTADFYMAGKYRTNSDDTVTLQPGYGYAKVLNGDTPVEMVLEPDEDGTMGNMYLTVIGQFTTFSLNSDGTWEGVGD